MEVKAIVNIRTLGVGITGEGGELRHITVVFHQQRELIEVTGYFHPFYGLFAMRHSSSYLLQQWNPYCEHGFP